MGVGGRTRGVQAPGTTCAKVLRHKSVKAFEAIKAGSVATGPKQGCR